MLKLCVSANQFVKYQREMWKGVFLYVSVICCNNTVIQVWLGLGTKITSWALNKLIQHCYPQRLLLSIPTV